jgi:hypothetical protein
MGTTKLELATSAVTGTDRYARHWKYVVGNAVVYRGVYRDQPATRCRYCCAASIAGLKIGWGPLDLPAPDREPKHEDYLREEDNKEESNVGIRKEVWVFSDVS